MTFLVDANVLSEATKANPSAKVVEWLKANEREIAVDPIILGEIRFGIHLLPAGRRRRRLEHWFEHGVGKFHCLPWGAATGLRWANRRKRMKNGMIGSLIHCDRGPWNGRHSVS